MGHTLDSSLMSLPIYRMKYQTLYQVIDQMIHPTKVKVKTINQSLYLKTNSNNIKAKSLTELHPEGFSQAEKEEQYETH